jgi:pilus assembly protein CpaC
LGKPVLKQLPQLHVARGSSETVAVSDVDRISVGNGKVIKVRPVSNAQILVTGLREGWTNVHLWDRSNREFMFSVRVLSPDSVAQSEPGLESDVIRVSLEFLELDAAFGRAGGIEWPELLQFQASAFQDTSPSGINLTVGFSSARVMIHHLARKGWAKILARPEIFVRMGEQAKFQSGGEFPVPTSSENYGRQQRHIEWKPYGMTVKVLPQSFDGIQIRSDIHLEISEINQERSVQGIPSLVRRNVETKMNSIDGETVILSGLTRQASSQSEKSLPWLSKIPWVGPLIFTSEDARSEETEVLMAVTLSFTSRRDRGGALRELRARMDSLQAGEAAR